MSCESIDVSHLYLDQLHILLIRPIIMRFITLNDIYGILMVIIHVLVWHVGVASVCHRL